MINDLLVPERCCLGRFLIPTRRRYMSYSQRTNQYMYTAKIRSQMGLSGGIYSNQPFTRSQFWNIMGNPYFYNKAKFLIFVLFFLLPFQFLEKIYSIFLYHIHLQLSCTQYQCQCMYKRHTSINSIKNRGALISLQTPMRYVLKIAARCNMRLAYCCSCHLKCTKWNWMLQKKKSFVLLLQKRKTRRCSRVDDVTGSQMIFFSQSKLFMYVAKTA